VRVVEHSTQLVQLGRRRSYLNGALLSGRSVLFILFITLMLLATTTKSRLFLSCTATNTPSAHTGALDEYPSAGCGSAVWQDLAGHRIYPASVCISLVCEEREPTNQWGKNVNASRNKARLLSPASMINDSSIINDNMTS